MFEVQVSSHLVSAFVHSVDKFGGDSEFKGSSNGVSKFSILVPEGVTPTMLMMAAQNTFKGGAHA